jgi:hypothetical protein
MSRSRTLLWTTALVIALAFGLGLVDRPQATETLFYDRCATCHDDDTPTCGGCHQHRGTLLASSDQAVYRPNHLVTITLSHSGGRSGWIRALLYDHTGAMVDLASGPTGTGDDGLGNPVEFPVTLQANAPSIPGPYVWEAAWFGGNNAGTGHLEVRRTVSFTVEIDTGVEEWPAPEAETTLRLDVRPNPVVDQGRIRYSAPAGTPVSLTIVDTSGRRVRDLVTRAAGRGEITWDGCDDTGRPVASGAYLALLASSRGTSSQSLLVLR